MSDVSSPMATTEGSGSHWTLTNKDYDGDLSNGQEFDLRFAIYYSGAAPDLVNMRLNGESICDDERRAEAGSEERSGGSTPGPVSE